MQPAPGRLGLVDERDVYCAEYTHFGYFEQNEPSNHWFFRRVPNIRRYLARAQVYFDQNISAFRFVMRMNGQPWLSAPIARKSGANTLSHFVAIAAR